MEKVYTIEYGYIYNNGERLCTNEISYIDYDEYKKTLIEILTSTIDNCSENGYYIECYTDYMELDAEDLQKLKDEETLYEVPKFILTQEYIVKNIGG